MVEGDASFTQVSNAPGGRTYVLKFQSSDQRHFVSFKSLAIVSVYLFIDE